MNADCATLYSIQAEFSFPSSYTAFSDTVYSYSGSTTRSRARSASRRRQHGFAVGR